MAEIVSEFPHVVQCLEHVEIPMPDGVRLAARIWMPKDAEAHPVPAILEYIPYRKRDGVRLRDSRMHRYLAGHGYACVRVDLRGSGDSDGLLLDQYRQQELEDGLEILRWIAAQSWCDGNVGMQGISWGGFNSLQIAALDPPQLKGIVTVCSTDDLYQDNMHYMGGCLLTDNLSEATTMFSLNGCPPDPQLVGDRWRRMWFDRLEHNDPWIAIWLSHQRRDAYWQHGSVSEDYKSIRCPVMAVGGWVDGYTNAIFRLLRHLDVPRLGLIGPWSHKYPHEGQPGPAIGFLQEMLRWWDKWLKGEDTGIMKEPMLRAWMQESVPPTTSYAYRPGRWVGEAVWPSPRIRPYRMKLAPNRLIKSNRSRKGRQQIVSVQSPLSVGLFAGKWCSYAAAPDLPHDQREEDGGALVFESGPLARDIEILGAPTVELEISSSRPVAMVAARLSDVAPDGKATRVTYGLLNLPHRKGHRQPEAIETNTFFFVKVDLNHVAQSFPKGHRIRLSVSTSYWPLAWPPPRPVRLFINTTNSTLELPQRRPVASDRKLAFLQAECASSPAPKVVEPPAHDWLVTRRLADDVSTLAVTKDEGVLHFDEIDLDLGDRTWEYYTYQGDDFCSLTGETKTQRIFRRGDWRVEILTRSVVTSDEENFCIRCELDAYEGTTRVFSRNWSYTIPRDLV